jgi:hypothetical protein
MEYLVSQMNAQTAREVLEHYGSIAKLDRDRTFS